MPKPVPMPSSIKVGPHTYSILRKPSQAMGDSLGNCDFTILEIWVKARLRRTKSQEILLHELLHACTHPSFNGDEKMDDESFVNAVAPVLLQVLQDNPELVSYLVS
jgi:hypothetical protein